jgi:hypothetical protein
VTDRVASYDLRRHRTAQAALREVGARLADQSQSDIGLLLVLDTPESLTEHALAYEELWRSRRVSKLLTVLDGPLVLSGTIEVPGSIGSDRDSGVIWVGDPAGVDWALSAATVAGTRQGRQDDTGLDALLDLLAIPAVFARVVALVAAVPDRVVSPGLHVFETVADQVMFLDALSRGIGRLLDVGVGPPATAGEAAQWPSAVRAVIVPGGRLASIRDNCTAEAAELAETAEALGSATALFGLDRLGAGVLDLAIGTGTGLLEYRDAVARLVGTPTGEKAARLHDWGLRPASGRAGEPADVGMLVITALAAGEPLPALSARLWDYERDLRAHGDMAATAQIERVCPPELGERFTEPPPVPGPQPWLIGAGMAGVTIASLGHLFGVLGGVVTALAWLALTGLTVVRVPGGRLAGHRSALVISAAAAVVGLAIGVAVAQVARPPAVVGEAGIVAGMAAVVVAVTWSWRVRVRRWAERLWVPDVLAAVGVLTEVVSAAASREWSAAVTLQDVLMRARHAVDGAASALRDFQAGIDQDLSGEEERPRTRHELDVFVGRGLALLLQRSLRQRVLAMLGSGQEDHEQTARADTDGYLSRWDKHVDDRHSPLEPPDFLSSEDLRGEDLRGGALSDDDIAAMREVVTTPPTAVMWQLCRAHDTRLLDPAAGETAVLRFAPRSARAAFGAAAPARAEWLSSSALAGVLRLVPVRGGVVRRTWSTGADPDGGTLVPGVLAGTDPIAGDITAEGRALT